MGETVTGNLEQISTESTTSTTGNHTNSGTTSTETKRRRGRPPGTTKSQEVGLSGLASINDEPLLVEVALPGEDKPEEQPKKKAGRPKGKTTAKGKTVDSTQIQILLVTMSALISSRPGMEVWNMSPQEAKQIADPLANILAKNEAIGNAMGEHADAFALITACFVVFLPKALLHMANKPKKPKQGDTLNYGTKQPTQPINTQRENTALTTPDVRERANVTKNNHNKFGGQLSGIIPAVGGF